SRKKQCRVGVASLAGPGYIKKKEIAHQAAFQFCFYVRDERRQENFNDKQTVFFFQAEDGIRDADVTRVQTCALPIFSLLLAQAYELLTIWYEHMTEATPA